MAAESLPIVCGYCRRPLRHVRGRGLIDAQAKKPHFYRGFACLFVPPELAQRIDKMRGA